MDNGSDLGDRKVYFKFSAPPFTAFTVTLGVLSGFSEAIFFQQNSIDNISLL